MFTLKNINFILKFRQNKSYYEKRTNSLLLEPLTQHLINITSFKLSKSLYSSCSNTPVIFVLLFQIIWIIKFMRPNSQNVTFLFSFPSILNTFLLLVTVIMLSHYQSPLNCRCINIDSNFVHKLNYHYNCHIPDLEIM